MKICPECAFANEERFPACLWCNALLVNIRSTAAADPTHPEHTRRRLTAERHARRRSQLCFALVCYAAVITLLAMLPGMIFDAKILTFFGLSGCAVFTALATGFVTQFPAMIAQGMFSAALVLGFDRLNVLTAFMAVGHVIMPAIFAQWIDLIDDAHI